MSNLTGHDFSETFRIINMNRTGICQCLHVTWHFTFWSAYMQNYDYFKFQSAFNDLVTTFADKMTVLKDGRDFLRYEDRSHVTQCDIVYFRVSISRTIDFITITVSFLFQDFVEEIS